MSVWTRVPCRRAHSAIVAAAVVVALLFGACVSAVPAATCTWFGAAEPSLTQTRNWTTAGNWLPAPPSYPPAAPDDLGFWFFGDGTIQLNRNQQAAVVYVAWSANPRFTPGADPAATMNFSGESPAMSVNGPTRDTYGSDYFVEGPTVACATMFNAPFQLLMGRDLRTNAAMMIEGQLLSVPGNSFDVYGYGQGNSLWIASDNFVPMADAVTINVNSVVTGVPDEGRYGHTLHFVDKGNVRGGVDRAKISLNSSQSYLGLHESAGSSPPGDNGNFYINNIDSYDGNIFADRSYQGNDMANTVNRCETIFGEVTIKDIPDTPGGVNFGSTGAFGRTNNGYSIRIGMLHVPYGRESAPVSVNNGNLTEGRAGSRYVSGANRLQEAHNYAYVSTVQFTWPGGEASVVKGGTGVLVLEDGGFEGLGQQAVVNAGVLSVKQNVVRPVGPGVALASPDAAVGIRWDTPVDLQPRWGGPQPVPFPVFYTGAPGLIGQTGAFNIDLWGHGNVPLPGGGPAVIDTHLLTMVEMPGYLRIGSSKGADASFTSAYYGNEALWQAKYASTQASIVPYSPPFDDGGGYCYYFGGGGTLVVFGGLFDGGQQDQPAPTTLEMGTTGQLLPGRVALKPMVEIEPGQRLDYNNFYSGATNIRAGTLQLLNSGAVYGSQEVSVGTYNQNLSGGLYATPQPGYTWCGPGQLLLDPTHPPPGQDPGPNLDHYQARGNLNATLATPGVLNLDGGVIGWTDNVVLTAVPGTYRGQLISDLKGQPQNVFVLGLGGEYSNGVMTARFQITDSLQGEVRGPVLLYKAGKNSTLDLTQSGGLTQTNTYTGGTIIAGGTVKVSLAEQLNAGAGNRGGPIMILNGGRLSFVAEMLPIRVYVPIMVNTDGTPDTTRNCGSVLEVEGSMGVYLHANVDFRWNPGAYLEMEGWGWLRYIPASGGSGTANAWGLKLTEGVTVVNQMPVIGGGAADTGPVIFNGGVLAVDPVPPRTLVTDPAYGFRCIVSMANTTSLLIIQDNGLFRTHGLVANELMGTIIVQPTGLDNDPSNNVVHLSRNMAPDSSLPGAAPPDYSRGIGKLRFEGVTVYMTGDQYNQGLGSLPMEAGFTLELGNVPTRPGVVFHASKQNNISGNVIFDNTDANFPVQINGAEAPVSVVPPVVLTPQRWEIFGTGLTSWKGITEKIGEGTVVFERDTGGPVIVNRGATLKISEGTIEAGGWGDPFTDTAHPTLHVTIINNSSPLAPEVGFHVVMGEKEIETLTGTGTTQVEGDAVLTTGYLRQSAVTLNGTPGHPARIIIRPSGSPPPPSTLGLGGAAPVPEPSALLLLAIAALALCGYWRLRRTRR